MAAIIIMVGQLLNHQPLPSLAVQLMQNVIHHVTVVSTSLLLVVQVHIHMHGATVQHLKILQACALEHMM